MSSGFDPAMYLLWSQGRHGWTLDTTYFVPGALISSDPVSVTVPGSYRPGGPSVAPLSLDLAPADRVGVLD